MESQKTLKGTHVPSMNACSSETVEIFIYAFKKTLMQHVETQTDVHVHTDDRGEHNSSPSTLCLY